MRYGFRSMQVSPPTTLARTCQLQRAPRREGVIRRGLPASIAPSRSRQTDRQTDTHTHTHTHTHTYAHARARGITQTSQPQTHARTPGPPEFSISSSSKLLLLSPPPLSARFPGPPELRCLPSLKARPVRPLSDAEILHRSPPPPFLVPVGTSACPREAGIY